MPKNTNLTQFACIVNQLHRLAPALPKETFPSSLTPSQLYVVGYLALHEGEEVYQRDLEILLKLRRSTLSSLLNTMERKDLIRRSTVTHDARLKKLVLTEHGVALSHQVQTILFQLNSLMLQGITPEEQEQLSNILTKIQTNLSQIKT